MESLPPRQHLAAPGKWPVVGERVPRESDAPWQLEVTGAVARPLRLSFEEIQGFGAVETPIDIHCVTRWSKLAVRFQGVRLAAVLAAAAPHDEAQFVSFVARSTRSHSSSLPLKDALDLGALLVWEADGAPIDEGHGGPLRVIVPGRYFYKSVKWVERIELLEQDRLGFWEATAGYHNTGDPWREERYMAPALGRNEMRAAIQARSFAGRDLRSLAAAGHDLADLDAQGALLRDADFTRCDLRRANFAGANLSNAHLDGADLRGANFRGADVEGASFHAADLRGADFSGASIFGATFCATGSNDPQGALIDSSTRIDPAAIDALSPEQQTFIRSALASASRETGNGSRERSSE